MESIIDVVKRRFIHYEDTRNKITETLKSIGISTLDSVGRYKDVGSILEEVSKVLKDFECENFKDRKEIINMETIWKEYYKEQIKELEDKIKNRCMIMMNLCYVLCGIRRSEELLNYLRTF